jgi:HK97 family phage portal protein
VIFRKIFNQVSDEQNEMMWKDTPDSRITSSGEKIDAENAFSNIGTIFECVVIRSNSISKLPLQLFKTSKTGKIRDKNHNLWYLLEKRPNKWQTPSQFKSYIEVSRLLWGNAYIEMVFDRDGNIVSLEPLNPEDVYHFKNEKGNYMYHFYKNGEYKMLSEDEIIHIPYVSIDGKIGKAPLEVARENAGNLQAITKFEGGFYKNGAMTTGVLETPSILNQEAKTKIKSEWSKLYGGASNAGSVAVLDAGFNYKPITIPIKDIEFISSRKMNKSEIATIFDVPLYMLNDFEGSKFNNVEQQNLRFLNDVLQPTITLIEEEFNYKLFTSLESKRYYVKFNLNSMLRADSKTRAEYYKEMIGTGVMSINKVLELEDMDSIGEMGDKHFMSLNFTTLDTIEQHQRILKGGDTDEEQEEG